MQNKKIVIISILVIFALFFGASYFYKQAKVDELLTLSKEEALLFQRPYSYVIGNENAKVQLVEFFDPACETCALFHHEIKNMIKEYDGKVKLVLRYAPFHKNSQHAIKMLEGAREQAKFMEVLELMFKTQSYWTQHHEVRPDILWDILLEVNILDMQKLRDFMNDPKNDYVINQDLKDAKKLNITKTPGFIVNGLPLQQFGLENLKTLIRTELEK